MKMVRTKESVEKELKRLLRSMDFVSENLLKNQRKRTTQQIYFDIYQGLGLAWEFLGLQCGHRHGYKRNKDGQELCRVCGKVKGVRDQYYLIPVDGAKKIGMRVVPNSKKVFENKKRAQLVRDEILFHGAALDVDVHNSYKSRFLGNEREIAIAADRTITLKENGIACSIDRYVINVQVKSEGKNKKPRYGAFPWELSKSKLQFFPVIFRFDNRYRFLGLTILRPAKKSTP